MSDNAQEAIQAFRALSALTKDADTGTLTLTGLQRLMSEVDALGVDAIEAVLEQMFQLMDADGDGNVTEEEFAAAAENEPQLLLFAENTIEQCVARNPHKADDVERARSRPVSPENGEDGALNDTVASTIPEEASTDDGDGPIEPERSDQSSDQAHTARDEILKLRETVRRLENELSGKDKEVQHAQQRVKDVELFCETHFSELEEQLQDREKTVTKLRTDNSRLKDQVSCLRDNPDAADTLDFGGSEPGSGEGSASQSPAPRSTHADSLESRLEAMTAERDLLLKEVEGLQADKQKLGNDLEALRKLAASKKRVSESALQLLEEENIALRERQLELEELYAQNSMLRDELDEARTSSTTQLPEDDPIEEDEGEKGEAPDLQFAYDMLQVEVKELRADATKVKDLRHRLAQLESQESVHSKRVSALDSELERKTSDNASLTTQVEALGFALDKMKAYLDASGGAVSMVSAKRMGASGGQKGGLMKKLGMASFRRPRTTTPRGESKSSVDETSPDAIDSIPSTPVSIRDVAGSPVESPQILEDSSGSLSPPPKQTPGSRGAGRLKLFPQKDSGKNGKAAPSPAPAKPVDASEVGATADDTHPEPTVDGPKQRNPRMSTSSFAEVSLD